jgi:hypothetical protein
MLQEAELIQVRDYVIKILPELLRSQPEIATTIEGILAQQFPRRDEFARLLDEVQAARLENKEHFEQVDQRFEQVDQRFEQVDQRFEQVDQRFEQVDQRFEQVDQRFEQVDRRFVQVDERFEGVDQRLDRLEKGQLVLRRDVAKLQSGQDYLTRYVKGMEAWIRLIAGQIRNEKGQVAEEVVALGLRFGLGQPDIKAENIRLRQKLVDRDGLVFPIPYETEVDLVANNGEMLVFEVKASDSFREVSSFAVKLHLLTLQNPDKRVRGVFIAPEPSADVRRLCEQYGIELVEAPSPGDLPE